MRIINDGANDTLFTVDGLPHRKGLYEVYYNTEADAKISIGIRNIYNQQTLDGPILPSQYLVNGTSFTDNQIIDLVTQLSVVLGFNTGGGGSSSSISNINNIAALRNLSGKSGQIVNLLGYYEVGDKSPVNYFFTTDVLEDNGGSVISTTNGSWLANFNGKCDAKDFGAIKDTDCTDIINRALIAVDEVIISDQYKVNPIGYIPTTTTSTFKFTGGIKPRTGNTLRGLRGSKLYIDPNAEAFYCVINCERVNDVKLISLTTRGDVDTHLGSTGEAGYGISMKGCLNFEIIDCDSTHFWGDGLALQCSKVALGDVITGEGKVIGGNYDYNRRNGVSGISGEVTMDSVSARFNGTINGTLPKYGVDIEPNNGGDDYIDFKITNLYTEGNGEGGIEFVPAFMQDTRYLTPATFKLKVDGYVSFDDGVITTQNTGSIRTVFADNTLPNIIETKPINGYIEVNNVTIVNSTKRSITFSRVPENGMSVKFTNINIINPCAGSPAETQRELKNAISFLTQPTQTTYGNIRIDGLYIFEPKTGTDAIITGLFFKPVNETDKLLKNIIVTNYEYVGTWNDQTETPAYGATDKSVVVSMSKPVQLTVSATSSMHNYSVVDEMEISLPTANSVLALPNSTIVKNKRIRIFAKQTAGSVFVQGRNDSQPIIINPRNSRVLALAVGASVLLELATDGTWSIIDYSGTIYNDQFPVRGTTAQRPTGLISSNNGFQYYDTNLNSYIFWNGTVWVTDITATYLNITSNAFDFVPDSKIKTLETTPTANCVVTVKPMSENMTGAIVIIRNNANFNITLLADTGVTIMGTNPYNQVVMSKTRESIILYCNANNSWRIINVNRISDAVVDVSATSSSQVSLGDLTTTALADAGAAYDATAQALINDLKAKYNTAVALINDLKAKYNIASTLSNSNKTQLNAKLAADRASIQQL